MFPAHLLNLIFGRLFSRRRAVGGGVTELHLTAQVAEQIAQNGNGQ